jgi:hypothetical protein
MIKSLERLRNRVNCGGRFEMSYTADSGTGILPVRSNRQGFVPILVVVENENEDENVDE